MPEKVFNVLLLNLQNILSIRVADRLPKRVGNVSFGLKLILSIISRKLEYADLLFISNKLIFQSPPIRTSAFVLFNLFSTGSNSEMNVFLYFEYCYYLTVVYIYFQL